MKAPLFKRISFGLLSAGVAFACYLVLPPQIDSVGLYSIGAQIDPYQNWFGLYSSVGMAAWAVRYWREAPFLSRVAIVLSMIGLIAAFYIAPGWWPNRPWPRRELP